MLKNNYSMNMVQITDPWINDYSSLNASPSTFTKIELLLYSGNIGLITYIILRYNLAVLNTVLIWFYTYFLLALCICILKCMPSIKSTIAIQKLTRKNSLRWLEYGLTSPIMVYILGTILEISRPITLVGVIMQMVVIACGYQSEVNRGNAKLYNVLGFIGFGLYWLLLLVYAAPLIMSLDDPVKKLISGGIMALLFVLFSLFGVNNSLSLKMFGRWKNYGFVETVYILLGVVSKSVLLWAHILYIFN